MKVCKKCGQEKPGTDFYRDSAGKDGLRPECKACDSARRKAWYAANREQEIQRVRAWQVANSDRRRLYYEEYTRSGRRSKSNRKHHLKRTFGLTVEEYDALLAAQAGGCAICGRPPSETISLHVDHDHEAGEIRGLLCFPCNNALGLLQERTEVVSRAFGYLANFEGRAEAEMVRRRVAGLRRVG